MSVCLLGIPSKTKDVKRSKYCFITETRLFKPVKIESSNILLLVAYYESLKYYKNYDNYDTLKNTNFYLDKYITLFQQNYSKFNTRLFLN